MDSPLIARFTRPGVIVCLDAGRRQSFRAQSCGRTIGKQGQMSTRVSTQADPSITKVACRLPYRACLTAFCLDTVARLRHVLGCCHLDNSEGWDCSRLICVFGEFTCATVAGYCQMGPNERLLAQFREAASRFPRELCL